jgi:hypothetical protein
MAGSNPQFSGQVGNTAVGLGFDSASILQGRGYGVSPDKATNTAAALGVIQDRQ